MKKSNSTKQLINLVTAALFAALIAVMTAYVSFKTGINDGYLHFGDSMIYIAACVLPLPYACAAAAVGRYRRLPAAGFDGCWVGCCVGVWVGGWVGVGFCVGCWVGVCVGFGCCVGR